MKHFAFMILLLLLVSCAGPATGPVKGVLIVYEPGIDLQKMDDLLDEIQLHVTTVDTENVFDFSTCSREDFRDDLKARRTILFITENSLQLPDDLQLSGGIFSGENIWAKDQIVLGIVLPGFTDTDALSNLLEQAYNHHLTSYIYSSFVSTQMSSPERIDSLLVLGFSMDIPKSYHLAEWNLEAGFIQYQRTVSDKCLILLSIRWIDDSVVLSPDDAVLWREAVARNYFYDSAADSVDRSSVEVLPVDLRGLHGLRLLGMWRNPEHLNAGAFTSYVLRSNGRRYLLDTEVFHENREKEPYIREGWIIMNTFMLGGDNDR
ncbi:MAG: DUF4837 family protein [Candidatus Aegiribacteria sp.]|nr:DUF4837 family protein [Candidatus Aegiribacteria sp.]